MPDASNNRPLMDAFAQDAPKARACELVCAEGGYFAKAFARAVETGRPLRLLDHLWIVRDYQSNGRGLVTALLHTTSPPLQDA